MKTQTNKPQAANVRPFAIVSIMGERIINAISEKAASNTFMHMFGNVAHIVTPKK